MSDRPKAAAGMVWLPAGLYGHTRNAGLGVGTVSRSAWTSPALVLRVWPAEAYVGGPSDCRMTSGTVLETEQGRLFYELDVSTVLEVLAQAWAQRGGRP